MAECRFPVLMRTSAVCLEQEVVNTLSRITYIVITVNSTGSRQVLWARRHCNTGNPHATFPTLKHCFSHLLPSIQPACYLSIPGFLFFDRLLPQQISGHASNHLVLMGREDFTAPRHSSAQFTADVDTFTVALWCAAGCNEAMYVQEEETLTETGAEAAPAAAEGSGSSELTGSSGAESAAAAKPTPTKLQKKAAEQVSILPWCNIVAAWLSCHLYMRDAIQAVCCCLQRQ